jgi:hypothetical protein
MKNVFVLPTDKPSRVYLIKSNNRLGLTSTNPEYMENFGSGTQNQHIYITSDEKFVIDEYITDGIEVIKATPKLVDGQGLLNRRDWKKIILTTDQDLDGVQPIDDEFLEWFVKNPSCESVKVVKEGYKKNDMIDEATSYIYKIIIPKEEQKQHLIDMMRNDEELELYDETEHLLSTQTNKERLLEDVKEETQRMYSEEEVIDLLQEMNDYPTIFEGRIDIKEWFEQLKKK